MRTEHDNDPQLELDVVLADGEDEADLLHYLRHRFGVEVRVNPVQYNSALTLLFSGTDDQLRRVKHWHAANRKPRLDPVGKPPVGKGEKRGAVRCRCGYGPASRQDLEDHVAAIPSDDPEDHGER
jgi:hypothetical protein